MDERPSHMDVIEKKAHTDRDGVLRIEARVGRPDEDCSVVMYVYPESRDAAGDPWQAIRRKLASCGTRRTVRLPPPVRRTYRPFRANELPGPSASEILIRDRR